VSHEENTVWLLAYLQGSLEAFSGSFSLDSKVLIFLAFSIQILLFFLWVKELGKQFSFSVVGVSLSSVLHSVSFIILHV
jgi:predicted membrane chloride channel (bestrophin family)